MAMAATFHSYRLFLNDSELAGPPPPQPKPEEKVDTKSVTPGTVVCRVASENPSPPKDYWLRSLIGTIICLPVGAVALYRSNQVLPLFKAGDEDKAQVNSKSAKKLSSIAVTFGICMWMFILVYLLISFEHLI
ncbi:uncharacterized protein [Amphiura filiformis]|uniref:uncharacterized protein n=1 Tax=Amphiura filiformis TaxID=82378 RepID=UPI003B228D96